YNNGTDEVIRRGKKIHGLGYVELIEHEALLSSITFRVRDDLYNTYYKVYIQKYNDPKLISMRCGCPYNIGEICRHEVAALLRLQDMIDKRQLGSSDIEYDQMHTQAKMKTIDLKTIKALASAPLYDQAETLLRTLSANITLAANERVEAQLTVSGEVFHVVIQKNDERFFDTSCTCDETKHPLCIHKTVLFIQLLNAYGPHYFDTIRNYDKEKNKLLSLYGYSLGDDLTGKFEFIYKDGKPFLKVTDPSVKRIQPVAAPSVPARPVQVPTPAMALAEEAVTTDTDLKKIGIVFNFNESGFPGFAVCAVQGEVNEEGTAYVNKAEKIDLNKYVNTEVFDEEDKMLLQQIRKLQDNEINKYLNRNSPFSGIWENIIHTDGEDLPDETKMLIIEYLYPKLKKIFDHPNRNLCFILPKGKAFKSAELLPVTLSNIPASLLFRVASVNSHLELVCQQKINGNAYTINEEGGDSPALVVHQDELFLWSKPEDVLEVERFRKRGATHLNKENWAATMKDVIMPLTREYQVEFDKSLMREVKNIEPRIQLLLQEKGDYLLFQPIFIYNGFEVKPGEKDTIILPDEDKILMIRRNKSVEEQFLHTLNGLHSLFQVQPDGGMALKGQEVLRNNWFFLFMDAMKEKKIPVYGFESLKNYRFNTARPSTHIHLSSGMDWFDAKVEIAFGDQRIGIADIKRALASKQSFVQLGDGTLGILPDEWLKKYALLFKVGEGRNDKLRLSKYHMSVIDELYENRDEEELSFALDEKFERLRAFRQIPEVQPPDHLKPVLRPYQVSGYQWLQYLNEVGWGGILADDMGLGKTVQALTMLHQYKEQTGGLKAIVVCPTTLIYNWKNEVNKFTPGLTCIIHHGNTRSRDAEFLQNHHIIVTTYGTLRSDITLLLKIHFDYVVLDESQAIKNPSSKVTKAASLLNATNRLCMSGTPLQNNTFDVYAQMNFLNPGLLGSVEFFRNEFANPIDKFGEQEQKEHLRKLLYPFILRRTKEQVAKDLPEKTETILFCEMEKEQRKIYDAYRNTYRDKIMGVIDQQGIDKSQLTILQGLMKLRQICDSPAILNEEEKFPNHSIKLDELTRELTENISDHKVLIFSQFLGMLGLIRDRLKEQGVVFEYLDGSTPSADREKAIRHFQDDETVRVFLISLKAGGVGLNLTAADYVYIVDPWWNPAVEQQAIDRTHRIGQTKNIFAYRMICIDTIEDKILQLQERKKALAKELITDDSSFVKALSKADVEYLFS
ncbi:MAG TPA: SNF2-related protein, partial [Ferruginibacter sp.]|nr:SNF2-related protein [Ferruginibacter sp.]HRO17519.1 SNF2-related protein [Ferruginibacter sp.]HRQ21057.1 SNF2-related protein [Ferruginibacter sp.]